MLRSARSRATDSILPTSVAVYPSTSARQRRAPSSSRRIITWLTPHRRDSVSATNDDRCRRTLACSISYVDVIARGAGAVSMAWSAAGGVTLSARRARSRRHPSQGTIREYDQLRYKHVTNDALRLATAI